MTKKTPVAIAAVVFMIALLLSPLAQAKSETTPREIGNTVTVLATQNQVITAKRSAYVTYAKPLPPKAVKAPKKRAAVKPAQQNIKGTPPFIKTRWGKIPKNTYHGRFYVASALNFRNCVVARESMGVRTVINSQGYSGLYQFGLSWTRTIQKWTGERVAIRHMSYQAQDLAFWKAYNFGRGAGNWAGGRWHC